MDLLGLSGDCAHQPHSQRHLFWPLFWHFWLLWPLYFHRKAPVSEGQSCGAHTVVGWRGYSGSFCRDCAGLPTASSTQTDTAGSSAYCTHSYTHTLNLGRASPRRVPGRGMVSSRELWVCWTLVALYKTQFFIKNGHLLVVVAPMKPS